jgi:hypothetical protein
MGHPELKDFSNVFKHQDPGLPLAFIISRHENPMDTIRFVVSHIAGCGPNQEGDRNFTCG